MSLFDAIRRRTVPSQIEPIPNHLFLTAKEAQELGHPARCYGGSDICNTVLTRADVKDEAEWVKTVEAYRLL